MTPQGLIDTGALIALLDRDDRWHRACVAAFERSRLPLATTEAVLTELFHLLDAGSEHHAAWSLLRSGAIRIFGVQQEDLPTLEKLMDRYRDRPMDFADATLVHLGSRQKLPDILTVDHNDFETYRMSGGRAFRIAPARGSAGQ